MESFTKKNRHKIVDRMVKQYNNLKDNSCKNYDDVYMEEDEIAGGLGIIENDFHERKDLTPNLCAIYVVPKHRGRGIAGRLLARVCEDMHDVGVDTLYLVTDHTTFYERYGWKYLCDTREHGGGMARVYVHEYKDTGR